MNRYLSVPQNIVIIFILLPICVLSTSCYAERPENPALIKLPFSFPGGMENTPVIYKGQPLLVNNRRGLNTKAADFYLFIEDLRSGQEICRFGETFSFVSGFVNGDELNVFATENTDDDWTHDIYGFSSTDLQNLKK